MGKSIITGITAVILLISLLLIGITVASVLTDGSSTAINPEDNLEQMTQEVVDEISSYIQLKDQKGKYYGSIGDQEIEKVAIWISPLVTQEIDMSQLTIQLNNGENVKFLSYDGNAENLESNTLFEHPIWSSMNGSNFGFISIIDLDGSLVDYDIINDCSDNAYLIFKLPEDMTLQKHEKIIVTLFPSTGITRITELIAPMPIKSVVTFE